MSPAAKPRLMAAALPGEAAAALAARHGRAGDRPALRKDLVIRRQVRMGDVTWVVKEPTSQNYYNFTDEEYGVMELFDGSRSRAEIAEDYNRRTGAGVDLGFVLEWEESYQKIDLLEQLAAERNLALLQKFKTARKRAAEAKAEGFNPFLITFRVVDPDRFLNRTVRYVRWIWTPPVVAVWTVAALWTIGVFAKNFQPIWNGTFELYAFLGKPLVDILQFFFLLSFIGGIHELGHAYATKIYGGEVHDIGLALLYFTPAFYCDTTDAILFPSKWQRLWVTVAGIYIEGFRCAIATALWVASYPDSLLHEIAFKTMLFTGVSTIFFNINPLIKIDGYYALSSVLELPELREDAFRYLGAWFQNRVLRLPVEVPVLSRRKRRTYWIYGVLALAYTAVIMRFIGGLFFNFYSKYFPNAAIALVLLTLYRIFRKRVRLVTRTARLFYLDKRDFVMSPRKRRPLIVTAGILLVLLLIPWAHRTIRAPIVLEPLTQVRLEAPEDAIVADVLAGEGDLVAAGQPLFRLASAAANAEDTAHRMESRRFESEASSARVGGSAGAAFQAERRKVSADSEVASDAARLELLTVRSPIAGRVLTPRVADLRGRAVAAGTLLAEVGDCRRLRANLEVSERRWDDLQAGQAVSAMLPGRPLSAVSGRVVSISSATLAQPVTASAALDPVLPADRPEKFVAVAVFSNDDGSLRPGMIGKAKIYSERTSALGSVFRVLRRWVQTIAW
ncbi:MAG: HlyD family efflux transporter periplasmic adaptor subunit [Acidobacteriota bacterium]